MFMRNRAAWILSVFLSAGLLSFVSAPSAQAGVWNQRMVVTVKNGPVAIPGRVLSAGTYVFQNYDVGSGAHLVGVTNAKTDRFIAFVLATPAYRRNETGKAVVNLKYVSSKAPLEIHQLFYPGRRLGHEFVYPHASLESQDLGALRLKTHLSKG